MLNFREARLFRRQLSLRCYLLTAFVFFFFHSNAIPSDLLIINGEDTVLVRSMMIENAEVSNKERPFPVLEIMKVKRKRNKRITAAVLAFPIPFGIVGLHRIYLGTAPYVPVVYVASLGGVLGILPFIDFCVLILDKEADRYLNNKKVFMWVNQ